MEGPAKLGIGVAVATLLIFGGILVYDQRKNATGQEPLGTHYPEQGRDHISVGGPRPDYNSNPPTSGPHFAEPAAWGSYDTPLPDEQLVHNLEHGGVNIFYKPDAFDQATIDTLKAIQRDFPNKTLVAPRPENTTPIALTSWTYLLTMDYFNESLTREFIRRNKNRAPEFFPD